MRNVSVVIEGVDGSGKTELCARLMRDLGAKGFKFPDRSTTIGKLIDGHLLGRWAVLPAEGEKHRGSFGDEHARLNAEVHQALQAANRLERAVALTHAMASGNVVIDRWWPSALVYGHMDGLVSGDWYGIHEALPRPDIFILLDIDGDHARERVRRRRAVLDAYELKNLAWFNEVCAKYRTLWSVNAANNWWSFDANRSADTVHAEVAARIDAWRRKENNIHG